MSQSRILIFAPYLPALGGGERYACSLARAARAMGDVTLAGPPPHETRRLTLGFDWPCRFREMGVDEFAAASADYDLAVVITNGIPPESQARRSLLVVQFPIEPLRDWRARQRVLSYSRVIVYSEYVRGWLQRLWGVDAVVISPPVECGTYDPRRKRHLILGVGRFFAGAHEKRHDILIDAFAAIESRLAPDWRLVLAGGAMDDEATRAYLDRVSAAAKGHRIDLAVNVPEAQLCDLYAEARLFWHATGCGRRADQPEKAEHFGMTTAEAMSYGAVPLVFADGGQLEIVSPAVGCAWQTPDELGALTLSLVEDAARLGQYAEAAARAARAHGPAGFAAKVRRLLEK